MRRIVFSLFILLTLTVAKAQFATSHSECVRTPMMIVNDEWKAPAVITLDSDDVIRFSFDEMSHVYHRYICRITHHNADGTPSELSEIDYLDGFNDFVIDEWENSHNTTRLYTHYTFTLPNDNVRLKVSGNYRVEIFDDEDDTDTPVVTYDFAVIEPLAHIRATVSGDTDRSFNEGEQQLTFAVNHTRCGTLSPDTELIPVIYQNRRRDTAVTGIKPTYSTGNEVEYTHNTKLIFEAGNEYRRFEITHPDRPGMNIENIIYHDSAYHALLYIDKPTATYSNVIDEDGRFFINTIEGYGTPIEADYINVHFALEVPYREGGNYYISGDFSNTLDANSIMHYDHEEGYYFASHLLKLGLYNYQYLWLPDGSDKASPAPAEGNFYNTENEYQIYIYQRSFGARYDRLVGFTTCR